MSLMNELMLPPRPRLNLSVGHRRLEAVTLPEAIRALSAEYKRVRAAIEAESDAHAAQMKLGGEGGLSMAAAAMISEKLGLAKMPSLDIWDEAQAKVIDARAAIDRALVRRAETALLDAESAYQRGRAEFGKYKSAVMTGAERAVTSLEVVEAAGAVAAGVATGGVATAAGGAVAAALGTSGLAATAGVVTTGAVGVVSAGAYGATQELAGQTSEVYFVNTRREIDWKPVLIRGAKEAAAKLVGVLVGGPLTKNFSKMFGSHLGKALSDADLDVLGKIAGLPGAMPRNFFMTAGQKHIAEFLSGAALAPVQAGIGQLIERVSGGKSGPKNMEQFMDQVAHDIVQGGVFDLVVAFLEKEMPSRVGK